MKELLEKAKKNKKGLLRLKNALITLGDFELASKLREIELEFFPESEEVKKAKNGAVEYSNLFKMVGLNIDSETSWLIAETLNRYKKKKGKFSLQDSVDIRNKKETIFLKDIQNENNNTKHRSRNRPR